MKKLRLLVVDDEDSMRDMLKVMLSKEGYDVSVSKSALEALKITESKIFDIILCDVRMPGMDGISFLKELLAKGCSSPVIMMSAYGAIELAVEAIKCGASDFVSKPFNLDEMLITLKKVEEREALERENARLKETLEKSSSFSNIIGQSDKMQVLFSTIKKVAPVKMNVLLLGESGTGKELVARALHCNSDRKDKPFIAINCGAIPENLVESELFGHVKGAFTDALAARRGVFEEADGGTLFLDEIGELPLSSQVKLLRVLQEGEIRRVGGTETIAVDVRVIAATTKNLQQEVAKGAFREDLYYRLNVMMLMLPPLRERTEDIPLLTDFFIALYSERQGGRIKGVDRDALKVLCSCPWPGNVRELENVIERSMVFAEGEYVKAGDLPPELCSNRVKCPVDIDEDDLSVKRNGRMLEEVLIKKALEKTGGNRTHAARLLEISHRALIYKIKEYNLN